ncbi:MAG: HEAT repeat domain-containing protein [Myxococcales bacterium]|nr:HEAT repeat domain-containing protein [Myxococcales bacterium]
MNLQQRLDTRDQLLQDAQSTQATQRVQAIQALGHGGFSDLSVLQFLREALNTSESKEVQACVQALFALQGELCLPWVIQAIPQMNRQNARQIARWLLQQGHRSARELSRLLEAEDECLYGMISALLCERAPDIVLDWSRRRLPQQHEERALRALRLTLYLLEEGWAKHEKTLRRQRRNEAMTLLLQQQDHSNAAIKDAIKQAFSQIQDNDPVHASAFRLPTLDRSDKLNVLDMLEKRGRSQHADCIDSLLNETDEEIFLKAMSVRHKLDPSHRHAWFERCMFGVHENRLTQAIEIAKTASDPYVWEDIISAGRYVANHVRALSIRALCEVYQRLASPKRKQELREILKSYLEDSSEEVRETAFRELIQFATQEDIEVFQKGLLDTSAGIRQYALKGIKQLSPASAWDSALLMVRDGEWALREVAYSILLADLERCPNKIFLQACREQEESLQTQVAALVPKLPEATFKRLLVALLTTRHQVVGRTIKRMKKLFKKDEHANILQKSLHQADPSAVTELCTELLHSTDDAWDILEQAFAKMRSSLRIGLIDFLVQHNTQEHALRLLTQGLNDENTEVRRGTFATLVQQNNDIFELSEQMRLDSDGEIRKLAVQKLRQKQDETTLALLLPMARDEEPEVRREVLDALASYDDPEVLSELVSSVHDVDEGIRELAKELLQRHIDAVPALKHARRSFFWDDDLPSDAPIWQRLHHQVDEVRMWASRVGQLLLGAPVIVHQYRQGLGRTWRRSKDGVIEIELADMPITQGHPYGEEIVKGLALHEIGHHLYDFGVRGFSTVRGIARSEGLGDLYDVLLDERLERRLRSRRPIWGIYFDRLASYAFAQRWHRVPLQELAQFLERTEDDLREAIESGELPGYLVSAGEILTEGRLFGRFFGQSKTRRFEDQRIAETDSVLLRDSDLLRIPGALTARTAFLWCLRCGFDPAMSPDPRIAQAMDIVQGDFRHLDHAGLLQVAREISAIFQEEDEEGCKQQRKKKLSGLRHLRSIMQRVRGRMRDVGTIPGSGVKSRSSGNVRKQEREIIYERKINENSKGEGGQTLHLGAQLDFPTLDRTSTFERSVADHQVLIKKVQPYVRTMRAYFERLGRKTVDDYASRRGRRLDMGQIRSVCFRPNLNVLVHSEEIQTADLYIGLLIDRSGSMSGQKLETAKAFGALLCESAKGLRGIQGHVHAFDDNTWYPLGSFEKNTIASLSSGGANNDAGALYRAANLALQSKKRQKLLVMISDGSPTECSVRSLKNLVESLGKEHNILCAQAAVETLPEIAFPHYVDLSKYRLGEAVQRFGKLLIQLTQTAVQ